MGDDAIGKIAACIKDCKTGVDGGAIHGDVGRIDESNDRCSDLFASEIVDAVENPDKFAEAGRGYGDRFGALEEFCCCIGLFAVIAHGGADEHVGVGGDLHF